MRNHSEHSYRALGLLAFAALTAGPAVAADLAVRVTDREGEAVADVAVYLVPKGDTEIPVVRTSPPGIATMEQIDNMFVPHLLVVETGTSVSFPNNDTVSHHVYSFSEAKRFQLDLYRGNEHPPQLFDHPGLVVLGCNIHDSMLGFILVVDTPLISITTHSGTAQLSGLPAGEYDLVVWTPRSDPDDLPNARTIVIGDTAIDAVSVQFTGKLSPPHDGGAGSLNWKPY
ncbi:MAG: methylamine utilization protein [Gammaproteobacteria bacterium]